MRNRIRTLSMLIAGTRRTAGIAAVAVVSGLFLALPARAFIGVGAPVFDAVSYAELILQFEQLVAQLKQAVLHYKMVKHSLEPLGNRSGWAINSGLQLQTSLLRDINGESQGVGQIVNGYGGSPQAAWSNATLRLSGTNFLTSQQPGNSVHLSNAASIGMTDAFSADAIQTVGNLRAVQSQIAQAIEALQSQQQALDDSSNTPVAQQNITNAAIMQLIKLEQSNAAIQAAILQQLTIGNTWQRNAAAEATNFYDQTLTSRSSGTADYGGGASGTLSSYRIP